MKLITISLLILGLFFLWISGGLVQTENLEKIFIVAALPNPSATDSQAEWLGIVNYSGADIFTDSLTVSINGSIAVPISKSNSRLTAGRIMYFVRDVSQWKEVGYELADLAISLTNKNTLLGLYYNNNLIQSFTYSNVSEDLVTIYSLNCRNYSTAKLTDYERSYNDSCIGVQPDSYPQVVPESIPNGPEKPSTSPANISPTTKLNRYHPELEISKQQESGKYEFESITIKPGRIYLSSLISLSSLVLALIGLYFELPRQLRYYRAQLRAGHH